ncbi:hypothetical protein ACQVP2_25355 [Methylobacterium aquaticum]|uniref:hypothetical protein n=1 Tax=Methylobacterium aquaticum TaxID=270351 RepID=UPI003D171336
MPGGYGAAGLVTGGDAEGANVRGAVLIEHLPRAGDGPALVTQKVPNPGEKL